MSGRQRGMTRSRKVWLGLLGMGLWLGAGCADTTESGQGNKPTSESDLRSSKTSLLRADSCGDLLTKIQDDAIAKLDLAVAQAKDRYQSGGKDWPGGESGGDGADFGGVVPPRGQAPSPTAPGAGAPVGPGGGAVGGVAGGTAGGTVGGGGSNGPVSDPSESGGGAPPADSGDSKNPIGSSDTNTQVEGVDEADFIKLVDSGKGMFLLHGNTLLKLKTYPAEALSLEAPQLKIEGAPSELFVTDEGHAVIFSSVGGYQFGGDLLGTQGGKPVGDICTPEFCGGGGYGGNAIKITLADVSGSELKVLRELYYEGAYVSSRRIDDVVRVVLQGHSSYSGLFRPEVDVSDPWGRPYPESEVNAQLDQWRERVAASIRDTELNDWVPVAKEAKGGKLVNVDPQCDSFYVPRPGLSDSGIVHVLSLDASKADAPVGGITVMGQASTIYSSLDRLVLAQPDYRWLGDGLGDVGFLDEQRTSLHVFALSQADTKYLASGFVAGHLPNFNPQFG
ncbi:MAG TPA: beta-propeller domain-containing protein, partial [Polyangiales bacterium]